MEFETVPALLLTARNPGLIDAAVNSHGIRLLPAETAILLPDTPYENLPALSRSGRALTWAYPMSALHAPFLALENQGYTVTHLRAQIRLVTGEEVISSGIPIISLGRLDRVPWSYPTGGGDRSLFEPGSQANFQETG